MNYAPMARVRSAPIPVAPSGYPAKFLVASVGAPGLVTAPDVGGTWQNTSYISRLSDGWLDPSGSGLLLSTTTMIDGVYAFTVRTKGAANNEAMGIINWKDNGTWTCFRWISLFPGYGKIQILVTRGGNTSLGWESSGLSIQGGGRVVRFVSSSNLDKANVFTANLGSNDYYLIGSPPAFGGGVDSGGYVGIHTDSYIAGSGAQLFEPGVIY